MAQSPPSCRRLYQTSRRHPRKYILTFSSSSPRDTHLTIFSRLSTPSLTIAFTLPLPTSTVTHTPTPPTDPLHRVTHPTIFFRLSTSILTFLLKRWSLTSNVTPTPTSDPDSPPLLTYPTIFPDCLPPFLLSSKRWSRTSNVTPTPISDPDSPPRLTYPTIFFHLSTSILTFLEAVEPNLQCHPYTNIRFRFHASPYLLYHFFPPLYLHFNFS